MKRILQVLFLGLSFIAHKSQAQVKILFDATKAQMAGNADWVIDADQHNISFNSTTGVAYTTSATNKASNPQQTPTPAQSSITQSTTETYWEGALSYWATDCVKQGYAVETLPYNGAITFGNSSNPQDLSKYKIFVVDEPNILFTATEKTAIVNFVASGGSLFLISDHTQSDRNNDGHDSPEIWNDLFTNNGVVNNPFGMSIDLVTVSGNSTNITTNATDSIVHGSFGNVSQVLWTSGATITIDKTANPTVKAAVYKNGASNTGTTNVYVAYARYGLGKVVAFADSSPFDDGSGDPNDVLYNGYIADANGNHQKIIMNATIWLATSNPLPVDISSFDISNEKDNILLQWTTENEINVNHFEVEKSYDGKNFEAISKLDAGRHNYFFTDKLVTNFLAKTVVYYRIVSVDNDGKNTISEIKSLNINHLISSINVSPNPVKNFINISSSDLIKEVKLYNFLGQEIGINQPKSYSNNYQLYFDNNTLVQGIYYLKITAKNGLSKIEKIVIE